MKFTIIFKPSDKGGLTVYVPTLPGCISEGETKEKAFKKFQRSNQTLS